jgi:hypothetical protein
MKNMNRVYLSIPIIANRNLEEDLKINASPKDILKRDIKSVLKSDILIAEVSNPSHGVGIEIAIAFLSGKNSSPNYLSFSFICFS